MYSASQDKLVVLQKQPSNLRGFHSVRLTPPCWLYPLPLSCTFWLLSGSRNFAFLVPVCVFIFILGFPVHVWGKPDVWRFPLFIHAYIIQLTFFFFLPCHTANGILVPQPGIEPRHSAARGWSPNHWTARGIPSANIFFFFFLEHSLAECARREDIKNNMTVSHGPKELHPVGERVLYINNYPAVC